MNKSSRFLGCFFLISVSVFGQKKKIEYLPTFDKHTFHYGFYLGVNQNDLKLDLQQSTFTDADISVEPSQGLNVGLIGDLRLHKNVNLRFEPGLISNTKNIIFKHLKNTSNPLDSIREVGSTYLHLPLVFKFSADRYKNIRPYLLAGVSYNHNFSSNEKNSNDNFSGEFRLKTKSVMYEVGIGVDFYLYFFKFSPSIRGVFALNSELTPDKPSNGASPWTDPIGFLGTRGVFINFAFE